jgi:glucose/arabinose dehydrogenase
LIRPVLFALVTACGLIPFAVHAAKSPYVTHAECDGLPRVDVATPAGLCVGLAASGFKFPRGILPLDNGDLIVADMAGWAKGKGSLWLLEGKNGYKRQLLYDKLDRPHAVVLGPDHRVYVGVVGGVFRFDPANPQAGRQDIIGGKSDQERLPDSGRHPLVSLVFDRAGDLYVNVGSASDNCEDAKGRPPASDKPCAEAEGDLPRGSLRRYQMRWPEGRVLGWQTYAKGLRNSMALAVHPESGLLLQGENGRDNIHRHIPGMESDEGLPPDEINIIERGGQYGWPYCYGDGVNSPEYPALDCSRFRSPLRPLPAHAAPLGMAWYFGKLLPSEYHGVLIVGYHGYRDAGHRVVAFHVDQRGLPQGDPDELISGWEAREGSPMGAPTDVKVGADGAVYLTEDRNGTVLRLSVEHNK